MGLGKLIRGIPLVGNPIADAGEAILSPGQGSKKAAAQATGQWQGLEVPGQANLTFGEQPGGEAQQYVDMFGKPIVVMPGQTPPPGAIPLPGGNSVTVPASQGDISPYDVGAPLTPTDYGTSHAADLSDPYAGLGNAFEGKTSAWGGLPGSAFEGTQSAATGLEYDPQALAGQRSAASYFGDLGRSGTDPIAEADYARKVAEAEQHRKGNTDAALQALEMRGEGNAGGQLNARLGGLQDTANSEYQSGLDFAAMKAGRRDAATAQGAGINASIGGQLEKTAMDRAAAEDKYNFYKLSGIDDVAAKKASGLDQFELNAASGTNQFGVNKAAGQASFGLGKSGQQDAYALHAHDVAHQDTLAGWERGNSVNDTNTGLGNQTATFNKVTAPQQVFGNQVTKTAGVTGALAGQGAAANAAEGQLIGNMKAVAGGIAGIPGAGGAAPAPAASAPVTIPAAPAATPFNWAAPANPNAQQEKPKFY